MAIGMAAIVIVSVGNTLIANAHINTAALVRAQALNYARQTMEQVQQIKNQAFGCSLPSGGSGTCTKDDQSCTPNTGYTSCWTQYPDDPASGTHLSLGPLHVDGGTLQLQNGTETVDSKFTRGITFVNDGADVNIKTATVDVSWTENGTTKHVSLVTEITGWKNL